MTNKPLCLVIDVDNTLALKGENRGPYDFEKCLEDRVNEPVADYVWMTHLYHPERAIIVVTGREHLYRDLTLLWLDKHLIPFTQLLMRETKDQRPDYIVKEELYRVWIEPLYTVFCVVDDRQQVVDMWRRLALPCFQVNAGVKEDREKELKRLANASATLSR